MTEATDEVLALIGHAMLDGDAAAQRPGSLDATVHPQRPEGGAFGPDGHQIVVPGDDDTVNIWNMPTTSNPPKAALQLTLRGHTAQTIRLESSVTGIALCFLVATVSSHGQTAPQNSAVYPAKRVLPAMAYDSDRSTHVLFGGALTHGGAPGATNDTWELIALDVPLINEQSVSQYRLAGETATFSVSAMSPSFLSYQWYRGSTAIPGATASTLTIANVQPADAGEYSVNTASSSRTHAVRSAVIRHSHPEFKPANFFVRRDDHVDLETRSGPRA